MKSVRVLAVVLALILLVGAPALVGRTSDSGGVFGRWNPAYFALLAAYGVGVLAVLLGGLLARPALVERLLVPLRGLRRQPWVYVLLGYGLVEGWYAAHRLLFDNAARLFGLGSGFLLVMWSVSLLEVFVFLVVLLAGREAEDLKNTVMNLALGAFGLGVAFVAFAYGYALIIRGDYYYGNHQLFSAGGQPDAELAYRPRPDASMRLPSDGRLVPTTTDANGFRVVNGPVDARIAGYGDSFLFGYGVEDKDVWPMAFAEALGEPAYNYGVSGYSIWQYNRLAERTAGQGQHPLVFYAVFANDLGNERAEASDPAILQRWTVWTFRNPVTFTLKQVSAKSPTLAMFDWIRGLAQKRNTASVPASPAEQLPYGYTPYCVVWSISPNPNFYLSQIDDALDQAQADGYTLVIVTIPSKESTYSEVFEPICEQQGANAIANERAGYAAICEHVAARGGLCYDMTADFSAAASSDSQALFLRADGHWSPRGHTVFAGLLADYFRARGLAGRQP